MYISKQLLLVTITIFGLHFQINASQKNYTEEQDKKFRDFVSQSYQVESAQAKDTVNWMERTYADPDKYDTTNELVRIVNDPDKKLAEKISSILQLKENEENQNKGYFSSMSTFAKAAAALVLTVGIASYLYFMRPWSTSAQ